MNPILFGHNPDERIVAASLLDDQTVRLHRREDGKTLHRDVEFFPFFFLTDPDLLRDVPGKYWMKELAGANACRTLVAFSRWSDMWDAVHRVLRQYNKTRASKASAFYEVDALFLRPDPIRQYLAQSGVTLFKGMTFADLRRVQMELFLRPRAPVRRSASKEPSDWILALTSSGGTEKTFDSRVNPPDGILHEVAEWIAGADADVVEGIGLTDRILPFLHALAEDTVDGFVLGRDARPLREGMVRGWSPTGETERIQYEAPGRHLIDLSHLIRDHAATLRLADPPTLRSIADDLGLSAELPPPLSAADQEALWTSGRGEAAAFALQRARCARAIAERLLPVPFEHTKMCPLTLPVTVQLGMSARIESILLREYIRQKHSIPRPEIPGGASAPGILFRTGLFRNVLRVSHDALGARLVLERTAHSRSDVLGVVRQFADALLSAHRERKTSDPVAIRALLRAIPAYIGNPRLLFGDRIQADAFTAALTDSLTQLARTAERFNGVPIQSGIDGTYLVIPDNIVGRSNEELFVQRIAEACPSAVQPENGERFRAMLSYNERSFALLDEHGRLVVHGASLIPRTSERFVRLFVQRCLECLLMEDLNRLHHTFASFHTMIRTHRWQVADFCRSEIAHESFDEYQQAMSSGDRNASAAHEAARRASLYVTPGMRISYYVTGTDEDVRIAESSRIAEEWDPNLPDENTAYYLHRLREAASRFRDFFREGHFERIFSMDDLFGFTAEGIEVPVRVAEPAASEPSPIRSASADEFSIWLADSDEEP